MPSPLQAMPDIAELTCVLSASGSYIETLRLKPIPAQPGMVELRITTQLLTAKNPEEQRVKARCCVERQRLVELQTKLQEFLADTDSWLGDLEEREAEPECPFCESTDACGHLLLVVDKTFRTAEGGSLMDTFNSRWGGLCETGGGTSMSASRSRSFLTMLMTSRTGPETTASKVVRIGLRAMSPITSNLPIRLPKRCGDLDWPVVRRANCEPRSARQRHTCGANRPTTPELMLANRIVFNKGTQAFPNHERDYARTAASSAASINLLMRR